MHLSLLLFLCLHLANRHVSAELSPATRKLLREGPLLSRLNPLFQRQKVKLDQKKQEQLSCFSNFYQSIPKVAYLPYTNVDVTLTCISALFFACFDYGSAHTIRTLLDWPLKESRAAGGSFSTILHSSLLVSGLFICLRREKYRPSCRLESHPTWFQDVSTALIQLCTGYMIYDAAVQFIADRWVPGSGPVLSVADWLFLGHHFATSFYMTSARVIRAGHMSAMVLMFFGELTAPIMNVLRLSNLAASIDTWPWLQKARPAILYVFAFLYVFIRTAIGPIVALHLTYDMLFTKEGRENIPIALRTAWLLMVWGVMFGSLPWIMKALKILGGVDVSRLDG